MTTTDQQLLNEWHDSKSGRARIRLFEADFRLQNGQFQVYALDGHELLPCTRTFKTEAEARRYANEVWARY